MIRHFLRDDDLSAAEQAEILELAKLVRSFSTAKKAAPKKQ